MSMLHDRAEDIPFANLNDFYEVIGYLCTPGRVQSIDAEVPESLVQTFYSQYPGSCMPISESITPSGLPGKYSVQFRINFLNVDNAPMCIIPYLKEGQGISIVNRINKSRFVENLVLNHGFTFGTTQNATLIRSLVPLAHLSDFNLGYHK